MFRQWKCKLSHRTATEIMTATSRALHPSSHYIQYPIFMYVTTRTLIAPQLVNVSRLVLVGGTLSQSKVGGS